MTQLVHVFFAKKEDGSQIEIDGRPTIHTVTLVS